MERIDYLIIGNSAAGINAAEAIRKHDVRGKVLILTEESSINYSKPLITYYLSDSIPLEKVYYRDQDIYRSNSFDLKGNTKIVGLDTDKKAAVAASGEKFYFHKALIAAGGRPIVPQIKIAGRPKKTAVNGSLANMFTLCTLEDARRIKEYIYAHRVKRAIILGGGLIGLKASEALLKLGLSIDLVELSDRILSATFDQEASSIIENKIRQQDSQIYTKNTINKLFAEGNLVKKVQLADTTVLDCRLLIVAVGVRPNTSWLEGSPVKLGKGIKVNEQMETTVPGIFAAGDIVEALDMLNGEKRNIAIWPLAALQGKTAGLNMAGQVSNYEGGFFMNSVEILGVSSISMGLTGLGPGPEVEVLSQFKPDQDYYRKIIIRKDRVAGAIMVGKIDRAGIYAGLIKNSIDISKVKENIIREDFGLIQLPADYQKHLVTGEGIEV